LDIAHLRDLLALLKDMRVEAFSAGGIQVTFKDDPIGTTYARTPEEVVADADRSTSSRKVKGFADTETSSIWDSPSLWPAQGGRKLRFDGSLE
jgi:hypothetical protein